MMENKHPFEDSFNNFNNEKSGTITVKEAAAALQLSEATVYKYIRDGLLESVELSFADTMRIKLESFQKLLTNLGNTKAENGISLNALAKRMNITKSRLQQILDSNNIEIPKILHGRREQYLITEEIQNQIHDILLNAGHFPKTHFFYSRWNIALYQAFTSKLTHNIYRIERDGNTWGIRTPTGILPFDVAEQQYELVPNYSLRQRARISDTVITICLPLQHEHFYSVIDTVYATFGMNNLNFQYQEQNLLIYVKVSKYQLQTPTGHVLFLNQFIRDGHLDLTGNTIILKSLDSIYTVVVPHPLIPTLDKEAKEANLTSKQLLNKLIKEYLKQRQKERDMSECRK